ncbi:MAG: class I SAM-dependent methyltransferase [Clostridia bacterium]|jgi:tRNA G37 N-methylase Trm5
MHQLQNALKLSHHFIRQVVREGDTVLDATVGNGNDTLFLARLVGPKGRVIGFDIQSIAIERTKEKLKQEGMLERTILIHDDHANILQHVQEPVRAAMFNLGYLPRSDHSITTTHSTTLKAVEACCSLLVPCGTITICIYYGHKEGEDERIRLLEYVKKLDYTGFTVLYSEFINQINQPPLLVVIQKNNFFV